MSLSIPRGNKTPIIWSIAGSDSSGGAGLQADIRTIAALGGHACTIVTSVTAQNSDAVKSFASVESAMLRSQLDALRDDMPPDAIKIGMLGNADSVQVLADTLGTMDAYTVYDPVMKSSSGTMLLDDDTLRVMRERLLPNIDLLTPNLSEAESLAGISIRSDSDVEQMASLILQMGVKAVLIKSWDAGAGFHQDYFASESQKFWLTLPQSSRAIPRGTGCTMASVLATAHAFGFDVADAAVIAKAYVYRCLHDSRKLGGGPPIIQHRPWPVTAGHYPWLTTTAAAGRNRPHFPDCGDEALGFYPVVDSAAWLKRILPLGVRTAQLRVKNLQGAALDNEIREAIAIAREYKTRLFINDYWQLALKHGAYGVHLGQEDLDSADMGTLQASGLRLGISTHSYGELARALALRPSYIALGPIFPTTLKSMRFAPQGLETLHIWRQLTELPLVAIGGITLNAANEIYSAGADSIAVVSDVTQHADPEARVNAWLQLTEMRERTMDEGNGITAFA